MYKVLTPEQVEAFIEQGITVLRGAFSAQVAAAIRERLWQALDLPSDDPGAWSEPLIHIKEGYDDGPFADAFTPRLLEAMDDLLGQGRYVRPTILGWWPVSFPGFDKPPWRPPSTGWHVDGIQFHHHIDSPVQGLLPLFIFSQIDPGGGGTAVALGSHRLTARVLRDAEPDGLAVQELTRRVCRQPRGRVLELHGAPGDVALVHPFMLHARSMNTGSRVRFICNPCVSLHEPINVTGPADNLSPLERSIRHALNI